MLSDFGLGRWATVIFGGIVILLLASFFMPNAVFAETGVKSQSLLLTAYLDGFAQVNQNLELDQAVMSINVTLLGETRQNLLVVDENSLPLDYSIAGNNAVIYNVGSTKVSVSYLTQDLTSKIGQYWTLEVDYPESKTVVLPTNASIISLSAVPEVIGNSDGHLTLKMPPGFMEVTYTAEHVPDEQTDLINKNSGFELWQIGAILSLSLTIPLAVLGFWLLKTKKKVKPPQKVEEHLTEVDLDKLFGRHRELRQDEIQVVRFLASKHGKAFEAELFEMLNLPRTTTWRLIKRLQGMEIVDVKKSRRQNVVLIRDKYLKKPRKQPD